VTDDAVIVVPLSDGRALALTLAEYQAALERGRELVPAATGAPSRSAPADEVTDAAGMEQRTGVPASWWAEAARRGDVPSIQAGKYRRFRVAAALDALEAKR